MIGGLICEDEPLIAEAHQTYLGRIPGFLVAGIAHTARDAMRAAYGAASSPAPIDLGLGDIYGTASAAPAAAAVVEAPAAAEVPATAAGAEEFDGPDPTGKICKWQVNAADGWGLALIHISEAQGPY